MFWMMNGMMGPRGDRRMHHRGYRPMGGLFLFPGILFGGLFGLYVILAVLNVAGVIAGAVFSGIGAAIGGIVSGIGSVFAGTVSGLLSDGGIAAGIVLGIALYYYIRRRKNSSAETKETL